jgi:amino acid transporter
MTWGWIIAMIGIQSVAMSMAELCSSMPTSGGLYYASAVLAPPEWGPFAAWITGWSNWLAQVTAAPSGMWKRLSLFHTLLSLLMNSEKFSKTFKTKMYHHLDCRFIALI